MTALVQEQPVPVTLEKLLVSRRIKIYQATRRDNLETIAVKQILLETDKESREKELSNLCSRMDIIMTLDHKNLLKHIHHFYKAPSTLCDPPEYHIYMDFCFGPDLADWVTTSAVTPILLRNWTKQIADGLEYLHKQRCVHRDIKGQNIMLSTSIAEDAIVKIIDLGDMKRLREDLTLLNEVSKEHGTYAFMSPETIARNTTERESEPNGETGTLGRRTDIWSLGCVVIELLIGCPPYFYDIETKTKVTGLNFPCHICDGGYPTIVEGLPGVVDDFIRNECLQRNPNDRPWIWDLKKHPMLNASDAEVSSWALPPRHFPSTPV